jgi:hypothetical protein
VLTAWLYTCAPLGDVEDFLMLMKLLVTLGLVTAGIGVATALPDLRRYMQIRSM